MNEVAEWKAGYVWVWIGGLRKARRAVAFVEGL
jgi:hypothetical protein